MNPSGVLVAWNMTSDFLRSLECEREGCATSTFYRSSRDATWCVHRASISQKGLLLLPDSRDVGALLITQLVKNPPAVQETWVQSLGWEAPLEKGKATHSSVLAWKSPCGLKWTVVLEKTLESLLDWKEIQPFNPKGNQSWIFTGRTDVEAETPIFWPPDVNNRLFGRDPDDGKDWRQKGKRVTKNEMVGCHHQLDGHEFE